MLTHYPGTNIGKRQTPAAPFPIAKPEKVPQTAITWYWHPDRIGAREAPAAFAAQLHEFDPELRAAWNPYTERWQIWARVPGFRSHICTGWKLLFPVVNADGSYRPLDERVMARCFEASVRRWGNGRRYFDRIESELERDKARTAKTWDDERDAGAREYFNHLQPSISMRGPSNGSKCSNL